MINGFIDGRVHRFVGNIPDFFSPAVQECFESLRYIRTIRRRRNLLRGNGSDADFLVGTDWSAQKLFDGGLDALWQVACLLNRDVLHGVNRIPSSYQGNRGGLLPTPSQTIGRLFPKLAQTI